MSVWQSKSKVAIYMPGRLESERLPNKLLLPLGDSCLWEMACKKLEKINKTINCYVLVHDKELIDIANKYGLNVIIRDEETTKVDGPLNYIFKDIQKIYADHLLFLNPCLYNLSVDTILKSIKTFIDSDLDYATSVKLYTNWLWETNKIDPMIEPEYKTLSTKDIIPRYEAAHCFHIFNKDNFLADGMMLKKNHGLIIIDKNECLDVDTEDDYNFAKFNLAKTYCFDLDNTLCYTKGTDYINADPMKDRIQKVNQLFENGNKIIIETGRGSKSKIDYYDITKKQLYDWGLKYHELKVGTKTIADLYIDDKAINGGRFEW